MRVSNTFKLKSAVAFAGVLIFASAAPGHALDTVVVHGKRVVRDRGQCINLPLRGAEVINSRTIALVAQDGGVALLRLSWKCMEGRSQQIAVRPVSASGQICSKRDIAEVYNGQIPINDIRGQSCAVTGFRYVGKLDETGVWDPKTDSLQAR